MFEISRGAHFKNISEIFLKKIMCGVLLKYFKGISKDSKISLLKYLREILKKNLENITCDTLLKHFKDILKKLENITRGAPFKISQRYFEKNENILKIF